MHFLSTACGVLAPVALLCGLGITIAALFTGNFRTVGRLKRTGVWFLATVPAPVAFIALSSYFAGQ